uniref:Uncharacterized protein n=1 Tax=Meloidogyne hapla TaxID=6305 RepID=A0A1I8BFA3_MELHA
MPTKIVNCLKVNSSPPEQSHTLFRKEFENKKTSGYFCKKLREEDYCGCLIEGKNPTNFKYPNPTADFFKIATAEFFECKKPENVAKNDPNKKMLIILDGCATCAKGGTITGLRVTHFEESGGFFSKCSEESEYLAQSVSGLSIKIPASNKVDGNSASFTFPATLAHRVCDNIFTTSVPKDNYVDLKLHIDYNCGQIKSTKVVKLPSVDVKSFKERVAELRGLWINLDDGKAKQYAMKDRSYIINDKVEGWKDAKINCWTKDGACKLD